MPMVDLIARSPMRAVSTTIRGGLLPGQVGAVLARAGVGKSAFLVHVALESLLRGTDVLHVSVKHPQAHVRSFYDEILGGLVRAGSGRDPREEAISIERHRVIHACLGRSFGPDDLSELLATLGKVMDFNPALVVVDGLDGDALDTTAWGAVATKARLRLWVSIRTHREHGPSLDDLSPQFHTTVALEPNGNSVALRVLRQGGETPADPPTITLDPTTMMLSEGASGDDGTTPASPAPEACTLFATGAAGAESWFGELAARWGVGEVHFTCDGHDQVRDNGSSEVDDRDLAAGDVSLVYVSHRLHRHWVGDPKMRRVLQLLWQVVSHAQQVFVVGSIQDDGTVIGGTGWSVELARRWHKRVWVYDQNEGGWYTWNGGSWRPGLPVIESTRFAGTGTRYLTDASREAIEQLFARSYGSTSGRDISTVPTQAAPAAI